MRLHAYVGASTALAGAVLVRAFTERPNFYSAAVYLGQSSACNLILMNFLLLSAGSTVFGLQRLLYGPLRPVEIEQLWDKGWYAVTETALAMTTFRDEVGGWFFILFMALLAGKIWNWIGDGRIEVLEQQPPANARLFHSRLIASLLVSETFNILMLQYCIHTLQEQPRPGMMVMFAFEFAVLFISSSSSLARYAISAYEIYVEHQQKLVRAEERREEQRIARQAADAQDTAPAEPEIDEDNVDVPGWQDKGLYVLFLDLATDFLKLVLYAGFFTILLIFSGIPIHMFRDLFITLRSFLKRINDYLKYRNATKDMNSRYSDATAADLERDNTCIICREDMHVWQQPNGNARPSRNPPDERQRPKKLPCGHILHVGCLRSWLERQQVCPVCRASVLGPSNRPDTTPNQNGGNGANGVNQAPPRQAGVPQPGQQPGLPPGLPPGMQPPPAPGQGPRDVGPAAPRPRNFRARTFGFGNFRMTLGIGNPPVPGPNNAHPAVDGDPHQILDQALDRYRRLMDEARHRRRTDRSRERAGDSIQAQLASIERRITEDINSLHNVHHQFSAVRALQAQLEHLRSLHDHPPPAPAPPPPPPSGGPSHMDQGQRSVPMMAGPPMMMTQGMPMGPGGMMVPPRPGPVLSAGHPDLPQGLMLPEGWTATSTIRSPVQRAPPERLLGPDDLVEQIVPSSNGVAQTQPAPPAATSTVIAESGDVASTLTSVPEAAPSAASTGTLPSATSTEQASAPRESTTATQNEAVTAPESLDLPAWGSNGASADSENTSQANGHTAASEHGITTSDGSATTKGKGKAATVEDADADADDSEPGHA